MNLHSLKLNLHKTRWKLAERRRGSTVLLVLAMLSILLLLGIAFSYSTRLESQASFNYAELTQARTAAATGLPTSMPMLIQASKGLTTTLQNWNTIPQTLQKMVKANGKTSDLSTRDMAALRQAGMAVRQTKDGELEKAPQANILVRDLSGLINLNAVPDQAAMQRVVSAVLPGGDYQKKSVALMALRGDLPSQLARQAEDNGEDNLDLRDPNAVLLDNLNRLRFGSASGNGIFTDAEIEKLASLVTVFSQSPEVYNLPGGEVHVSRVPLDAIEPKLVYDTLKKAFPGKKDELLLQFAANVADFSDEDDEPTILDSTGNVVSAEAGDSVDTTVNRTVGVEMIPVISEIYPDAATSVGFDDDGQFIEITNPWNKSVSLVGWTLRSSSGVAVTLTQQLPARGYLLITDNYDSPKPDCPPGHGSVVSIFGATADGATRQVMVQPGLNIPDRNATISLYDPSGRQVDWIKYGALGQVDGKQSYQRTDPLVRGASYAEATPFRNSIAAVGNNEVMSAATAAWEKGNTTITKLSQLFAISTGFVEKSEAGGLDASGQVHASQLAEIKLPEIQQNSGVNDSTDPLPNNLDLRLIDVFTATQLPDPIAVNEDEVDEVAANRRDAYQAFRDKLEKLRERSRKGSEDEDQKTTVSTVFSFGKLNLNTCSKFALLGLNLDMVPGQNGKGVAAMIEQFEGYRLRQVQQGKAPFLNVSDFVSQFVPNISRANIEVLDSITDQVSVGSSAFEITATNRLSAEQQKALDAKDSSNGPRPATAMAKWVISTDQEPYSIVSFTMAP